MELPLGLNVGLFIFQLVNFLILVVLLYGLAYRPLIGMLEDRQKRIAKGMEDARVAGEARANAEAEARKVMDAARADAQKKAAEIISDAQKTAGDLKAQAARDVEAIRAQAAAEAEQSRTDALAGVRDQIAALSMAAANKIVGESLDDKRQRALVDEFFSGVKAGKVEIVADAEFTGNSAEVTSALPLTDEQRATVRRDVLARLDDSADVNFRVDPNILGGLVVRVGDKIIDGSARGKLENLRQSLS